MTIEC